MVDHVANRQKVIKDLRRELVGPDPSGPAIDIDAVTTVDSWEASNGPWTQLGSGEEILTRDNPNKRYGVGVLFPPGSDVEQVDPKPDDLENGSGDASTEDGEPPADDGDNVRAPVEAESDDFDLSMANAYHPSSIGVSFLVELPEGSALVVNATGGRYKPKPVFVNAAKSGDAHKEPAPSSDAPEGAASNTPRPRTWWLRTPVEIKVQFSRASIATARPSRTVASATNSTKGIQVDARNVEGLDLRIEVFSRPDSDEEGKYLLTVCLVNRSNPKPKDSDAVACLFQSRLEAAIVSPDGIPLILPYPEPELDVPPEDQSLRLLYRNTQVFATGHGCAADWTPAAGGKRATAVVAECLPTVEVSNITPDIHREDGSRIAIPMAQLAGLVPGDDGRSALLEIIELYESWIRSQRPFAQSLDGDYGGAATANLDECVAAANRMREGLDYLVSDPSALRAFQLANQAILLQQIMWRNEPRPAEYDASDKKVLFPDAARRPDLSSIPSGRGEWRPFQIAFLLSSIASAAQGHVADRRLVDLIWFPTGGGKTEAYLGLAAFAMFKRRLDDKSDAGVHVLMRYTLRLLTTQQFQRASTLICAMEYIRLQNLNELGSATFSSGIWLGGETTPNTRQQAVAELREYLSRPRRRNPFLLTRCPWCGAEFGRKEVRSEVEDHGHRGARRLQDENRVLALGYEREGNTVVLKCPDKECDFSTGLPIWLMDEDIYDNRPTLIIGTIDKFAMLAWQPKARALFGLNKEGERISSPPGLIIQDELHLIAGPLGSMAGLYETVIEELCTDRRHQNPIFPKIICSTATTRRYTRQVNGLYARDRVALFPPPELEAGKSFFSRYDEDHPGRIYAGVHAPSLGSVQTEWVRVFASLFQAPMVLPEAERDPWWTMVTFFNSIREMGTAHTLFQSDVPDYLKVIWNRKGTPKEQRRYLSVSRIFELTGGLDSGEIAAAIAALEVTLGNSNVIPKDVCLASSVIEVGIDISRLSLMVVAGQPKTTAQYIQVTGRVGRSQDKPGLVVTMYSPSKPRDRSHYERFRSYHERLYANVEPTSVTPFSIPVLRRALHAVLASYVRQAGQSQAADSPSPFPDELVDQFKPIMMSRVGAIDPVETESVVKTLERRVKQWRKWKRSRWARTRADEDTPLLRTAGEYASEKDRLLSWSTQKSMRNVDAECTAEITSLYFLDQDDEEEDDA